MKAKTYGQDEKARALSALIAGERVRVVARRYGIPEGTVKSWRYRLKTGRMQPEKKGRFGVLLRAHTEELLRSLAAQSDHLRDPGRIVEIPTKDLAILWGSLFDRTMRMLELYPALTAWPGAPPGSPKTTNSGRQSYAKTNRKEQENDELA